MIIYANHASEKIYGYGQGELIGQHVSILNLYPETSDLNIIPAIKENGYWNGELIQKKKNDTLFNSQLSCSLVLSNSKPIAMIGSVRDITRQKRIEKELKDRNEFIETILDNLPIGLAVNFIDKGRATYINKKFEEIYGWPKNDLEDIDTFFGKIYPDPAYREAIKAMIMKDIQSGTPEKMAWDDITITRKDGEKRIISAKNIPLYDQNLMISTVQDLTETKRLQARLQQSEKMEAIGTLAGGIAHDFNNILSSILGFAQLALDDTEPGSSIEKDLQEVLSAGHRARRLVRHILTFARQDTDEKKPTQIKNIINESLIFLRSTIPTSIDIREKIVSDSWVIGNSTQILQVIMNLCTNAAHAMETMGGVLSVTLEDVTVEPGTLNLHPGVKEGKYIRLTTKDTGSGISDKIIHSIFEPYFTTKEHGKGTGMGLAIVHGIIEEHNGYITVISELEKGSTFSIYLPTVERPEEMKAVEPVKILTGSERILFVDDEISIARMWAKGLERLGYSVKMMTRSKEALSFFRSNPDTFDLIVTDLTMPELTGDKLAAEIIGIRPDIPIVLCSGYGNLSVKKAVSQNIKAVLQKPVSMIELAQTVRKILDKP